ncbi:MAG: N-acetylmuramoyl-L-alanine amidase [Lachnospiraceae bacterium]|nr:N-acetylmuramoyl-L-alanine amidase [Lachnospiraceae bacterium]
MRLKIYRLVTVVLVALVLLVTCIYLQNPDFHVYALQKQLEYKDRFGGQESIFDLMKEETDIVTGVGNEKLNSHLRVELPKDIDASEVEVENDYLNQMVLIRIPGVDKSYVYDYPMIGRCDKITDVTYENVASEGELAVKLDGAYMVSARNVDRYIYIDFVDLHKVYDKVVLVDAGHGGKDAGASKQGVDEKDVDLAILLEMKSIFDNYKKTDINDDANVSQEYKKVYDSGNMAKQNVSEYDLYGKRVGVFYTRTKDVAIDVEQRSALANALKADAFLSIHNNSTSSGRMSTINGTEVMYKVGDTSGKSKEFAQICLDKVLYKLQSSDKGLVAGDDIYIIRTAEMPVALVEVGFMTNQEELDKLKDQNYQHATAEALCDALSATLIHF